MPRYHFNVIDGHELFDSTGVELPDQKAAMIYAKALMGTTESLNVKAVKVLDDTGQVLFVEKP